MPLTVTELTSRIKQVLEQGFARIEVVGEVSRLTRPSSGHLYFTIKDAHATITAVAWRSTAARLKTRPQEGQAFVFTGHLSVYEPRGNYQLVVTGVAPVGAGKLAEAFERQKAVFAERGWFDARRKKTPPKLPAHIGIVTSASAAAFEDVKKVLRTRPAWLRITLSPAVVQGEQAASSIARAIARLHHLDEQPDVILLVRGGGSMEDLWCFNDEKVVKAVVEAKIPVISGIGHEIDTTLADLAADVRAATPSNAAELACPAKDTLRPQLQRLNQRLHQALNSFKDGKHWSLERTSHRLQRAFRQALQDRHRQVRMQKNRLQQFEPNHHLRQNMHTFYQLKQRLLAAAKAISARKRQNIAQATYQLRLAYTQNLQHRKQQWQKQHEQLQAMNPRLVLKRGYAITTNAEGKVVSSIHGLTNGEIIGLHLHDGKATAQVTHKETS